MSILTAAVAVHVGTATPAMAQAGIWVVAGKVTATACLGDQCASEKQRFRGTLILNEDGSYQIPSVSGACSSVGGGFVLGLLSEGYRNTGHTEDAVRTLAAAFAMAEKQSSPFWNPELHRLQGELALADPSFPGNAEESFRRGLQLARDQGAKSLELRLAISLSRLLEGCGKQGEARSELAAVYDWFTEGFATRDLVDANALLEKL